MYTFTQLLYCMKPQSYLYIINQFYELHDYFNLLLCTTINPFFFYFIIIHFSTINNIVSLCERHYSTNNECK